MCQEASGDELMLQMTRVVCFGVCEPLCASVLCLRLALPKERGVLRVYLGANSWSTSNWCSEVQIGRFTPPELVGLPRLEGTEGRIYTGT